MTAKAHNNVNHGDMRRGIDGCRERLRRGRVARRSTDRIAAMNPRAEMGDVTSAHLAHEEGRMIDEKGLFVTSVNEERSEPSRLGAQRSVREKVRA